jgi:hypothetical protein
MFNNAGSFNQPLNNWNVLNVDYFNYMFYNASSFNQSLGNWVLPYSYSLDLSHMLSFCGMDCANYSATLIGWSTPNVSEAVGLGAYGLHYGTNAQSARNHLINTKNWNITGDTLNPGICYPTSTNDVIEDSKNISVYPNPTNTVLHIRNSALKELQLYNSLGQLLFTTKRDTIDVSAYAKGIYYLKCEHQVVKVVVE